MKPQLPSTLLLLLLLALCVSASVHAAEPFAQARARGELHVGVMSLPQAPGPGVKVRTPDRLDAPAAQRLAQRLGLRLVLVAVPPQEAQAALADGRADVVLADRIDGKAPGGQWVASQYSGQPKAVIRSDTALRSWDQVRGHSVCMAESNSRAQALARQYGAKVQTYKVPSDALVGVREGSCDIGLLDDSVWAPLMRFPEWRKFSSSLPPEGQRAELGWVAQASDTEWLTREMRAWNASGVWNDIAAKWARDVAFDVYLDQEVPDCHG